MNNPLAILEMAGQSVWLDDLSRRIIDDGTLDRLIAEDGLKGMTSNPSIFEKAIGETADYDARIEAVLSRRDHEAGELYEALAIADIQAAADRLRPVYDRLEAVDGYVSLEVSPALAFDTEATVAEARRLWRAADRPNVMIKVPGTAEGVPAIRRLVAEGVNVNVTLLFGIDAYLAVADAHMAGLEALKAAGDDIRRVRGVASFFVSRIDTQIDRKIDARMAQSPREQAEALKALRGRVAIANAKVAHQRYLEIIASPRWRALAEAGAAPQRLLWASTGTKDPTYSDVLYAESLIGPDTIDTMTLKTLEAFRDHGEVRTTLTEGLGEAQAVLDGARSLGLDLQDVTDGLIVDGVRQFQAAFDGLLAALEAKRQRFFGERLNRFSVTLPATLRADVDSALELARAEAWPRRLWSGDATLWTGADEAGWLGWLEAARGGAVDLEALAAFQAQVRTAGYTHALLLGMGGSSLAAEVMARALGPKDGFPRLLVLDSTDPDQIRRIEAQTDPARTLFIVSSKSGATLEVELLGRHFLQRAREAIGDAAPSHFVAVTDPGSPLEAWARKEPFRRVFVGQADIGGRYSALSNFGMVPAAVMGLDVRAFLADCAMMARACGPSVPPAANAGVRLGVALGVAARAGLDKVTFLASDPLSPFGPWLEQLLAESTGKAGKGIVPVDGEPLAGPDRYASDRLFVYLRRDGRDEPELDEAVAALEARGHAVVRILAAGPETLGQEFVRWEVATAIAGAVLGLNPFDQPDVEASKQRTRALTQSAEAGGGTPAQEEPIARIDGLALFADARNARVLEQLAGAGTLEAYIGAHFQRAHEGDYIALLAFLDRNPANAAALQRVRARLRDRRKVATALGFGPRYLHSTGQAYKGGANTGVFLQITAEPSQDIPAPDRRGSFGDVEAAQAQGDFEVLAERGRRALRLHLGRDVEGGLRRLVEAVERSLG